MASRENDAARFAILATGDLTEPHGPGTAATKDTVARPAVRALVISSDTYPPQRVDVTVLFGEEIAGRGHQIDWILQCEQECHSAHAVPWRNGCVWVGPTDLGNSLLARIHKHLLGIMHDCRVFALARRGDHDIIIVKDKFASGLFALLAAKWLRRRFIFWLSYPFPESYLIRAGDGTARYPMLYRIRGGFFWLMLYKILLPGADHIFVQSEKMLRDVASHGIAPGKMTAVPMGIRAETASHPWTDQPRRLIPTGEPCILYLGTLISVRRLDFLIRVLAKIRMRVADAKLYLVGGSDDPADVKMLRDEAARLGLSDAVVLTGQLPQSEALCYVREADVCVSPIFPTPILNVGSPTKLVEYMAMGKAVVANDHPEQRLVIEESGGGYCVPWDEHEFSEAILKLILDPATARKMGERGRQYVIKHRAYGVIADVVERELVAVAGAGRT